MLMTSMPARSKARAKRAALTMAHSYPARTILLDAESEPACLFHVIDGWIAQARMFEDGRRQITDLMLPGDLCHPVWVFDRRNMLTVFAVTPVTVQRIPLDGLAEGPDFGLWGQELARTARIQTEWMVNLGRKPALERIAHLFCETAARLGHPTGEPMRFDFPLTQTDLADICGLTSVHVNRTLQQMRAAGLITVNHRQLEITDYRQLAAIGGFDAAYLERRDRAADHMPWKNVA